MATKLDVSKSRRFDIAMSRRTRRSTSLAAYFQDQYVPSLTQHRLQDAKLETFPQCQDAELHQFEEVEQQTQCLYEEDDELRISWDPLQYEDEQEKKPWQYQDREQKKQELHQYGEEKKPEQYLDDEKTPQQVQYEDGKTSKYQDEKHIVLKQFECDVEKTTEQYYDVKYKAPQQCQEADDPASEQHEDGEKQQPWQESCHMEQKTSDQPQGAKNIPTIPCTTEGLPRFSLQELIQEKQLPVREAKLNSKLGPRGENVLADHKVSGSGGATGGTTLAMVIRHPEGGKKSIGMIRRCVKALNQMIKAKHGSKKSTTL